MPEIKSVHYRTTYYSQDKIPNKFTWSDYTIAYEAFTGWRAHSFIVMITLQSVIIRNGEEKITLLKEWKRDAGG